jgi:hypothetical protein
MSFRISKKAENFGKQLRDNKFFETKFDVYYICAMVGLSEGYKDPDIEDADEILRDYPKSFREDFRLVNGLLVSTYLKDNGVSLENRVQIRKVINKLLDPNNAARLTDEGFKQLNMYSAGGADILNRWFSESPRNPLFFATVLTNKIRK